MAETPPRLPIVAVGAVIWNGREVLLIRRGTPPRQNAWSIPGGKVEWGETMAEALLREVREETGLAVALGGIIEVVDSLIRDEAGAVTHHHVLVDFTARYVSGVLAAGSDAADARFVAYADLDRYDMWTETRRIIDVSARAQGFT